MVFFSTCMAKDPIVSYFFSLKFMRLHSITSKELLQAYAASKNKKLKKSYLLFESNAVGAVNSDLAFFDSIDMHTCISLLTWNTTLFLSPDSLTTQTTQVYIMIELENFNYILLTRI